MLHVLTVFNFD